MVTPLLGAGGEGPRYRLAHRDEAPARPRSHRFDPQAQHGEEIEGEDDSPEADVAGQDLDGAVQDAAGDEQPGQCERRRARRERQQSQAGGVEEQRPFELVGKIGADARFDVGPGIAAVDPAADAPDRGRPGDGEQDVQERGQSDVGRHREDQGIVHVRSCFTYEVERRACDGRFASSQDARERRGDGGLQGLPGARLK